VAYSECKRRIDIGGHHTINNESPRTHSTFDLALFSLDCDSEDTKNESENYFRIGSARSTGRWTFDNTYTCFMRDISIPDVLNSNEDSRTLTPVADSFHCLGLHR